MLREAPPGASPLAPPVKPPIKKLSYNHLAMADMIVGEPWISGDELAARFGMTPSWISTIISSDLFQALLAERRDKFIDPELRASVSLQLKGLLERSMDVLRQKLDRPAAEIPDQLALQVMKNSSASLGMGAHEARISINETHVHLEELGNNLVGLLRRHRQSAVVAEYPHEQKSPSLSANNEPRSERSGGNADST